MEDVRPCLRCNNYCICHFFKLIPLSCAVNPTAADEEMMDIPRTSKPQNVAVIGGGPGGMEAAILAANAGHRVTLYDKADKLGGHSIDGFIIAKEGVAVECANIKKTLRTVSKPV